MTARRRAGVKPVSAARMLDVLRLIAEGHTYARIGRVLGASEDTVKGRARALLDELDARDRAHAVAIGYQRGYFGLGDHDQSCALRRPQVCDCEPGSGT